MPLVGFGRLFLVERAATVTDSAVRGRTTAARFWCGFDGQNWDILHNAWSLNIFPITTYCINVNIDNTGSLCWGGVYLVIVTVLNEAKVAI